MDIASLIEPHSSSPRSDGRSDSRGRRTPSSTPAAASPSSGGLYEAYHMSPPMSEAGPHHSSMSYSAPVTAQRSLPHFHPYANSEPDRLPPIAGYHHPEEPFPNALRPLRTNLPLRPVRAPRSSSHGQAVAGSARPPAHPHAAGKRSASKAELTGPAAAAMVKRGRAQQRSAPARLGKWREEDEIILTRSRNNNDKWEDISSHFPERSPMACRLHYQNYVEKRDWNNSEKDKFARLYDRYKTEMFLRIARDMDKPVRACERIHWELGREELSKRANRTSVFRERDSSNSPEDDGSNARDTPPPSSSDDELQDSSSEEQQQQQSVQELQRQPYNSSNNNNNSTTNSPQQPPPPGPLLQGYSLTHSPAERPVRITPRTVPQPNGLQSPFTSSLRRMSIAASPRQDEGGSGSGSMFAELIRDEPRRG